MSSSLGVTEELFGTLLRTARHNRVMPGGGHMTSGQLAMAAGVGATYIIDLEAGRRDPPSPTVVAALADALKMPPVTLLRASIRQRGKVELLVQFNQVGTAALLADAWPHLDEDGLAMIRDVIATVKRGKAHG